MFCLKSINKYDDNSFNRSPHPPKIVLRRDMFLHEHKKQLFKLKLTARKFENDCSNMIQSFKSQSKQISDLSLRTNLQLESFKIITQIIKAQTLEIVDYLDSENIKYQNTNITNYDQLLQFLKKVNHDFELMSNYYRNQLRKVLNYAIMQLTRQSYHYKNIHLKISRYEHSVKTHEGNFVHLLTLNEKLEFYKEKYKCLSLNDIKYA